MQSLACCGCDHLASLALSSMEAPAHGQPAAGAAGILAGAPQPCEPLPVGCSPAPHGPNTHFPSLRPGAKLTFGTSGLLQLAFPCPPTWQHHLGAAR
ncbi:hypothetical protein HaLaN_32363 [Haematococcus lacustris]|uniref:Uncharacterized protein n=1 Tax=Haematococcus lacustris TaxID=44745 RepID=A0A6A0AJV3_HAELA|nr:hypothetical protein HaLaN_32363 [Haematococcus lacustris]